MASSSSSSSSSSMLSSLLLVLCMLMMAAMPAASSARGMARHMKLNVFFHDKLNVTDVLIAEHAPGAITQTAAPYGSIFVINDRVTASHDPNSAWLGAISGLSTDASFDGVTYFCTFTVLFNSTATSAAECPSHMKGLHGTLNVFGLVNVIKPQPHAISGGTGSFMFAQGTATIVPIDVRTFNQVYRLDLDVYWPF